MNVRFGIIFLVVAMVFAIGLVRSEEAEAETMVRREAAATGLEEMHGESKRSPNPLDPKKLLAEIKKRLGRSADPEDQVQKFINMLNGRKGRQAARSADPEDDVQKFINMLNGRKGRQAARSADPGKGMTKFLEMLKNGRKGRRAARSADPGKGMTKFLEMLKNGRKGRKAERSADPDPDPGMLDMLKKIPVIGDFMG